MLCPGDDKTKLKEEESYVKVEIKGTLDLKGSPEENWDSILKGATSGVRILTRGQSPRDEWPSVKNGDGLQGIQWEIFLGDDEALKKVAKNLKGKTVVARGTLTTTELSSGWRFRPTIRLIVRISSLEPDKRKE
jgi:hypothetical protein